MLDLTQVTTRENARSVPCPRCGATAGLNCWGRPPKKGPNKGKRAPRKTMHAERHAAAIAAGAPSKADVPTDPSKDYIV